MGGVLGTSLTGGALALLGVGSVACDKVHVPAGASFKQPVTLTIGIFWGDAAACRTASAAATPSIFMARMIAPVERQGTPSPPSTQKNDLLQRALRALRSTTLVWLALAGAGSAHDLEKTQVPLTVV